MIVHIYTLMVIKKLNRKSNSYNYIRLKKDTYVPIVNSLYKTKLSIDCETTLGSVILQLSKTYHVRFKQS